MTRTIRPSGRRALITGAAGQDGLLLTDLLLSLDYDVFAMVRDLDDPRLSAIGGSAGRFQVVCGDLVDRSSLERAVELSQPHEVYNLAAMSSVHASWQTAESTSEVNAMGVVRLLEVLRATAVTEFRFYQASSSEIFGRATSTPQNEDTSLKPRSPYGVAKAFAHQMVQDYRERHGIFACGGITYNHESELRPPSFVVRKITQAVARISLGMQDAVVLGDLDARRDWGFAGDYVAAMWLMLQAAEPNDFVIASGRTHSVRDLLDVAFAHVGVNDWHSAVAVDPDLVRGKESTLLTGDATRARNALGWQPTLTFEGLIQRMVDHDLALLEHGAVR